MIPRDRKSAVYYIYIYICYPYTRRRCGLRAKEKKERTGRKKDIASLDARRIAL